MTDQEQILLTAIREIARGKPPGTPIAGGIARDIARRAMVRLDLDWNEAGKRARLLEDNSVRTGVNHVGEDQGIR